MTQTNPTMVGSTHVQLCAKVTAETDYINRTTNLLKPPQHRL